MKIKLILTVLLFLVPATLYSNRIDRTNSDEVVMEVLTRFKEKNYQGVAELCAWERKAYFQEIIEQGNSHSGYDNFFSDWRIGAVNNWDGTIKDTRYRTLLFFTALVKFLTVDGQEMVVELEWINGKWYFDEIISISSEQYEKLDKTYR